MTLFSYVIRAIIALSAVLSLVGYMVWSNEHDRTGGTEIILETNPIDPRDLFFGHYAILGYRDFNWSTPVLTFENGAALEDEAPVYIGLDRSGLFARSGAQFLTLEAAQASSEAFLAARIYRRTRYEDGEQVWDRNTVQFDLPAQYLADPETALTIQDLNRAARRVQTAEDRAANCIDQDEEQSCEAEDASGGLSPDSPRYGVILSVSDTGEAVIKGLYLDGEFVYDTLTGPRLQLERQIPADG
jgi:hypothetical protein